MNKDQDQKKVTTKRSFRIKDLERLHPHEMLLYLSMIGISLVFVFLLTALSISFLKSSDQPFIQIPKSFIISTILILISSYAFQGGKQDLLTDKIEQLLWRYSITFLLGITFCIAQIIGWQELYHSGVGFQGNPIGTYLYFLSGMHILHLVGGILFLVIQAIQLFIKSKDPVKRLIAVTNPYEVLKLRLLTIYWHFMDALWLILFVCFLFIF